jgi:hypothetical protein
MHRESAALSTVALLLCALLATGCSRKQPEPEPAAPAAAVTEQAGATDKHLPPGIDW